MLIALRPLVIIYMLQTDMLQANKYCGSHSQPCAARRFPLSPMVAA